MHFLIACLSAVREEERKRGGDKTGWGLTHLVILARGRSKLGLVEGGHTHTHTQCTDTQIHRERTNTHLHLFFLSFVTKLKAEKYYELRFSYYSN